MPDTNFGIVILGGVGLVALGYGIGWWIKGLTFITHRAIQDELWTRKLKFAEQKAVDADSIAARCSAQHLTQQNAMEAAREWTEELEAELSARGDAIKVQEEALNAAKDREDRLGRDLVRHEEYKDEIEAENESLRADLGIRTEELDALRVELEQLKHTQAALEGSVADAKTQLDSSRAQEIELREELGQKSELCAQLDAKAVDLEENPPLRKASHKLLARWENEARILPEEAGEEAELLAVEIDQLDPMLGALVRRDRKGLLHKRSLKEAKEALRVLEQEAQTLRAESEENVRMRAELEEQSSELFALRTEFEAASLKLTETRGELETARAELEDSNSELGQTRSLFDEVQGESQGTVAELQKRIEALAARVEVLEPLEEQLASALAASETATQENAELRERTETGSADLAAALAERDELASELKRTASEASEATAEAAKLSKSQAKLETKAEQLERVKLELAAEKKDRVALQKDLARTTSKVESSLRDLEKKQAALAKAKESLAERTQEAKENAALAKEHARELAKLQKAAAAAPKKKATKAPAAKKAKLPSDDLSEITGVGPKLSQALQAMGVTSYKQIANLKPADLPELAEQVGTTPARIKREKWIASAKSQHKAKYGTKA